MVRLSFGFLIISALVAVVGIARPGAVDDRIANILLYASAGFFVLFMATGATLGGREANRVGRGDKRSLAESRHR